MKKLLIAAGAGAFIFFGALALPASAEESGSNQGFLADITAALAEIRNSIFSIQSDVTQLKEELSGLRQQIPAAASTDAIKGVFKRGDSNAEIERIQRCLAGLGYGTFNGEFTTVFGSQTEEALKIFQNSEGIAPFGDIGRGSGKFGPQTQARLNAVCKARGLLAPGQSAVISILGGGSSSFLSGSSSTSTLPLPDLRMTNLSASSTSGTTTNNWNFYGTVLNRSLANAGPSNTRLRIDVSNNGTWDIQRMNPTGPLSSGGSELESFLSIAMTVTGVHKYEICADALNAIVERSEANNCSSSLFYVSPPPPLQPDLYTFALSNTATASTTASTTTYYFYGSVGNQGVAASSSSQVRLRIDFFSNGWDVTQTAQMGPIGQGWGVPHGWGYATTTVATPGNSRFEVCADNLNSIAESNEANNCSTKTF